MGKMITWTPITVGLLVLVLAFPLRPARATLVAPRIAFTNPVDGGRAIPVYSWVSVTFEEGVNPTTVHSGTFFVNQGLLPVSGSVEYIAISKMALFIPDEPLAIHTTYTATLTTGVRNPIGQPLPANKVWSFTTTDGVSPFADGMNIYFGDLHSHSGYSDGEGSPADAYRTARANGLDFFALTDHSHSIDAVEWQDTLAQAGAATMDGEFVGLRGFEYTGTTGHMNVFETQDYVSYTNSAYDTLAEFYAWLAGQPTAIGQFNHPAKTDIYNWNFNNFAYDASAAQKMYLREAYFYPPDQYLRSLDMGWRLGAVDNSDTHEPNWGMYRNMGVVAPSLTQADILDALRARRTFSTPFPDYALVMRANGAWMGSVISTTSTISFTITAYDPTPEFPLLALILYDNGQPVTITTPLTSQALFTWNPRIAGTPGHYYYAKSYFDIDGWVYTIAAYTSPIWTDSSPAPRWDLYIPLVRK